MRHDEQPPRRRSLAARRLLQVRGFVLNLNLSLQGGEAVKEQLGNIRQSSGVAAGDAFTRELFDEIAEEEIHWH